MLNIVKKDLERVVIRSWILHRNPYRVLSKGQPKIFNDKIPGSHFNFGLENIELAGQI